MRIYAEKKAQETAQWEEDMKNAGKSAPPESVSGRDPNAYTVYIQDCQDYIEDILKIADDLQKNHPDFKNIQLIYTE